MNYMRIDSEVYFWKYEKSNTNPFIQNNKLLQQTYLPEQITQTLHRNGVGACVAVVTEDAEVETRFLSELAITHPEIKAVVGWIDLYDSNASAKLKEFLAYHPIHGYKLNLKNNSLPSKEVMDTLAENQLSLDITTGAGTDIPELSRLLQSYPEQNFILQDAGNPDIKQPLSAEWENRIRILAKNKNLSCKVSGFLERGHSKTWKPADFYPFLDILFDAFGIERLMYASNWPFLLISGMYLQWKSLLEKFTEKFSEEERELFFGDNAARIYRL